MPFPNNQFTKLDPRSATGRRVDMRPDMTPRNFAGTPIDPTEWNRNDGFSPGSMVLANVPGLDLGRTGAAPITDIGASLRPDAPIVLLDANTGQRHPYFAELDQRATDPNRQALIIRPAKNLTEGHRYLVALRNLRDAGGNVIPPGPEFAAMLGHRPPSDRDLFVRWLTLRPVLAKLRMTGVRPGELYLAWDFTVASRTNLTGRAVHMRDQAFDQLGDAAPRIGVTSVTDFTEEQDPLLARRVLGTIEVPKYLDRADGGPGSRLHYGPDGRPAQNGTYSAVFQCIIPRTALTEPGRPMIFGHGLFGSHTSVDGMRVAASESNTVVCATSWAGMSGEDLAFIVTVIEDLSRFPAVPDRMQQAYVNALYLGRAMIHAGGLAALPAFQDDAGRPLLDAGGELGYVGVSLGGIQGTALTGLAQDFTRSVLVVPATNFGNMLNRASPFELFQPGFDFWYADKIDQQLGLSMMQMVWDRGEGNGYAAHIASDPLPGTPRHRVLMQMAFGDHQVANMATEVAARTIGTHVVRPFLEPGRIPDVEPAWGLPTVPSFPFAGSVLTMWDSGSPPPPLGNRTPTEGRDPHGDIPNTPAARAQAAHFLRTGAVIDVCAGAPCRAIPTN